MEQNLSSPFPFDDGYDHEAWWQNKDASYLAKSLWSQQLEV